MGVPFRRFGILIRVMDVLFRPAVSMGVPFRPRFVRRFVPPFRPVSG